MAVTRIAIPARWSQIAVATALGALAAHAAGAGRWARGLRLRPGALGRQHRGAAARARAARQPATPSDGRIAVGWLVVEDLVMVLALVLLPALAGVLGGPGARGSAPTRSLWTVLAITLAKVALFVALMLVVGARVFPWSCGAWRAPGRASCSRSPSMRSRSAWPSARAELFDVSFALGAFFAGMVINGSDLSHARRRRPAAAAGCVRRAVLRLGRHAVRPAVLWTPARGARGGGDHRRRQVAGGLAIVRLLPPPNAHRAGGRRGAWPRSASSPSSWR